MANIDYNLQGVSNGSIVEVFHYHPRDPVRTLSWVLIAYRGQESGHQQPGQSQQLA